LHAVLCAAGFNIRWLLRAIVAKGLAALPLVFPQVMLYAACIRNVLQIAPRPVAQRDRRLESRRYQLVPVVPAVCA
jgi:transposase, IS5 family